MSATETPAAAGDKKAAPAPAKGDKSRLPLRIAWIAARVVVVCVGALIVAHWLDRVWTLGWFQLAGAALICLGLPLGFQVLIRRKAGRLGGVVRFPWLTMAALINLPVLIWVGAQHPATLGDALSQEGLGSLKWVARNLGATVPGGGEEGDGEADGGEAIAGAGDATEAEPTPAPVEAPPAAEEPADNGFPTGTPVPFENESGQMVIQARVGDAEPMNFVLDTGATYSTLSAEALAALGQSIPDDAPVKTMRTAGGEAEGPVVLLDSVQVGGQRREGVAFWICEPCASGDSVGLLGLNVWQGYLLTIDPADQNVWLQPKEASTNRLYDVESFLAITSPTSRIEGDTVYVDLLLSNNARRDVDQAVVLVTARDEAGRDVGAITVDAGGVPGLGSTMATGTMPEAGQTSQLTFSLIDARW